MHAYIHTRADIYTVAVMLSNLKKKKKTLIKIPTYLVTSRNKSALTAVLRWRTATMTGCKCRRKRMLFGTQGTGVAPSHAQKSCRNRGAAASVQHLPTLQALPLWAGGLWLCSPDVK